MKRKVHLANRLLVSAGKTFYGKRYFRKKVLLIEDGTLRRLTPPFVIVANHASFADVGGVEMMLDSKNAPCFIGSRTQFANFGNILIHVGMIPKKQFTVDTGLIRDIRYVMSKGRPLALFPEAKLSVDGTPNPIPPAIAKLIKLLKVPLVTVRFDGSYLHKPRWSTERRFLPLKATVKVAATAEEAATLSAAQLHERIVADLTYDDYRYQRENGIEITSPHLVEGLECILYRCPACGCERKMTAQGDTLTCGNCGQAVTMNKYGVLEGGVFDNVHDWYESQRQAVAGEVAAGAEEDLPCQAEVMVKNKFRPLGQARFLLKRGGEIDVFLPTGEDLHFPKGTFYTLSFNNRYVFLPKDQVYRFSFAEKGTTTKLNLLVEEYYKKQGEDK